MDDQPQIPLSPRESLLQFINAYQLSQCLYVASELGIADSLKDGPKHYEALAKTSGAHPNALFRLLRALASAGIFNRLEGDRFELNELSEYLCRDALGSLRAWAVLSGQQIYPTWSHLLHSVKTGEIAFDSLHGMSVWQYRAQNLLASRVFDEAMTGLVSASTAAVVEAYDFSRFDRIVDVGGGQGALIAGILKANPSVRGILFDVEQVVQGGKELLKEAGVLERCETVAGSFLEGVPSGGDVYLLKNVIHDWDDQGSLQILRSCRRAMSENQTLLIIERVIASDKPRLEAVLADLNMMVMNGGRERTREDFQALLSAAGFELAKVIPTRSPYQIIEGESV